MSKFLCKIFRFVLNIFEQVVAVVATAIKTVGHAVVDVLSSLAGALGDALFSNPFVWALLGVGALFLFNKKTERDVKLIEAAKPTTPLI